MRLSAGPQQLVQDYPAAMFLLLSSLKYVGVGDHFVYGIRLDCHCDILTLAKEPIWFVLFSLLLLQMGCYQGLCASLGQISRKFGSRCV
jgi:hypothetical protein